MRKLTRAAGLVVALVVAGVAVAHGIEGAKTATAVSGTFSASAGNVSSKTCTTADGKTVVVTNGTYTGTAAGGSGLAGAITLRARSVVNTTDSVGVVTGSYAIKDGAKGAFSTVYDHGSVAGLATGRVHGPSRALVANVSATFSPTSGFTNGKLGGGTSGGSAVEVTSNGCKKVAPTHQRVQARGTISSLGATSITVAGVTCAIPSDASSRVNGKFKTGDTVEIECAFANGAATLAKIEGRKHRR
jgi:hypothetical protein